MWLKLTPRHGVPHEDKLKVVTYWYDLELDEDNNIVGGEWYTNRHPDFLWTKKTQLTTTEHCRSHYFTLD